MSVRLICGDCLEVMPTLPDHSVDMILADLPYGTTACKWDVVIPFEPLWAQYKRLIKRNGAIVLTASQPFTTLLIGSNPDWFKYCWVWNKRLSGNFLLAKVQPLKVHEDVCVFSENGHTYNPQMRKGQMRRKGGGHSNLWQLSLTTATNDDYYPTSIVEIPNTDRSVEHPTQKPVTLMEYLIRTYTNEGETVLDNTMGSGTTLVACVNTGRNGIGIELRQDYFAIAQQRIAQAEQQLRLAV
jgi:site-specific DNA-methyltransferase (adenine-specific)